MTYDYEDDVDGEQHICTGQKLADRGFTVRTPEETHASPSADSEDGTLADADLETPEGSAAAFAALRHERDAGNARRGGSTAGVS